MKKLLAVDGNSIINRAYYGIRPLSAPDGTPTNAVYGFMNIIHKHLEEIKPDYFVVAFDVHAPTFRHKFYTDYKAGRKPTPPDLLAQFEPVKDCLKALGAVCIEKSGYEADDILGTYSAIAEDNGVEAYIVTGDRDSLQLISDNTTVLLATTGESVKYDRNVFFDKYGIYPERFVDMKALMGDSSDNIPGVAGIGEKGAGKLIATYESIENLYDKIDEAKDISENNKAKLISGKDSAFMSKRLARIDRGVPDLPSLERVEYKGIDKPALAELFNRLGFKVLITKFGLEKQENEYIERTSVVPKSEKINAGDLPSGELSAFIDYDTNSVYYSGGTRVYECEDIESQKNILEGSPRLVFHDIKSESHTLSQSGISPKSCIDDVMLMGYMCSSGETDFSIEKLASRTFGATVQSPADKAFYIYKLREYFKKELEETNQYKLYREVEFPLSSVLYDMEVRGFKVDVRKLHEFSSQLQLMMNEIQDKIFALAGHEFNINSPKQLGEVLFNEMGLPNPNKNKISTSADILEKLKPINPIAGYVLEYREYAKFKSTYADALSACADENGRVHTNFKQALTATGRLSSTEPNLQNIPIRTELGRNFRKYFVAENTDYVLVDADYSQIELRLLAAISGDENLTEVFLSGGDIHASTAMRLFGVEKDQVTIEQRKHAKAINFGIMYGMGSYSLSQDLQIPVYMADDYIKNYLRTYPKVADYFERVVANAKTDKYVTTLLGRRRYIPELSSSKKMEIAFGERVAKNSPIQGTAADIIKVAMVNVFKELKNRGIDAHLIMQVHDELIIESAKDCLEEAKNILKDCMENAVKLSVPLTVEVNSGDNWYEAH